MFLSVKNFNTRDFYFSINLLFMDNICKPNNIEFKVLNKSTKLITGPGAYIVLIMLFPS